MSGEAHLLVSFAAGLLLGTTFFGGLWWTVRNGVAAENPALWFGLSALLRMAVVISGMYLVVQTGLASLLVCVCGLLLARFAVTRLTRTHRREHHAPQL
jgi:F1F0 ATPase subunit 2